MNELVDTLRPGRVAVVVERGLELEELIDRPVIRHRLSEVPRPPVRQVADVTRRPQALLFQPIADCPRPIDADRVPAKRCGLGIELLEVGHDQIVDRVTESAEVDSEIDVDVARDAESLCPRVGSLRVGCSAA